MRRSAAIGVDLGATNCRAALFYVSGEPVARREIPSVGSCKQDEAVERLAQLVTDLAGGQEERVELRGVGIGCPGPIDREREVVLEAPNMPSWDHVPLRSLLENKLGVPVALENDANIAVYGEYMCGSGKNVKSLLGLTLGTGIGGGFVEDGRIICGAHGMAWEVGHMHAGAEGIRCGCGAIDCLEVYASGEGIKRWYARERGSEEHSCRDVFHLAGQGDEIASRVVSGAAVLLGRALASLQKIIDPEAIILSGGLSRERDLLLKPAEEEARRNLFASSTQDFDLKEATLGTDAGLYGAAELIFRRL